MQTEADYYALFEAYQRGELAADARASLEARLSAEPRLHQLYTEFGETTGTLAAYAERRRTRQTLAQLHTAMLAADVAPEEIKQAGGLSYSVNPRLNISRTERKLREFWSGHRATVGVAASVAVLAVFSTLLGLEAYRTASSHSSPTGYTQLVRTVNQIKKSQQAIIRKIADNKPADPTTLPVRDNKFSGTGFALTADGYLVTSAHVVLGADSLLIEGRDHQRYHAETVYADQKHDLAILRIKDRAFKTFGKLPYTFKAGAASLGERVYTLGYPREDVVYGEGALSASSGFDSDTAYYQISIPVNPGNSGGPLLDERGNLIGVVSGRQDDAQGAAFATKSSYLMHLVDSLKDKQPTQPYHLPHANQLAGSGRAQQVKRLQDFVFVVKVYEQ